MKIIDISVILSADTPRWPGSPEFRLQRYRDLRAGDDCNNSRLSCDVHTGTHIDAPAHFMADGASVEQLPLETFLGPATVCHLPGVPAVRAVDLESLALPMGTRRLLLRTDNSSLWNSGIKEFRKDYVGITHDAALWVAARGIRLIGLDYLSVTAFDNSVESHKILLRKGIVLLEGINLNAVEPGEYELICLPLNLQGAEGAPARAVLRRRNTFQELSGTQTGDGRAG